MNKSIIVNVSREDMRQLEKAHVERNQSAALVNATCFEIRHGSEDAKERMQVYMALYKKMDLIFKQILSEMTKKYTEGMNATECQFVYAIQKAVIVLAGE